MSLLFLVVMIIIVVVAVLEVHEINQEQSSKEGSFHLKITFGHLDYIKLNMHLDVKVKRKVDPKVVGVSEDLLAQSCPLLGDLTNLKFLFNILSQHSQLADDHLSSLDTEHIKLHVTATTAAGPAGALYLQHRGAQLILDQESEEVISCHKVS